MAIMIIADVIFSGIRKSILKYGNVNAKFTIITLTTDASIPYTYPSVNTDIKNTENTMTAGINMSVVNVVFIIRHNPTPMAIITSINSTFFIMSLHLHPLFFLLFCIFIFFICINPFWIILKKAPPVHLMSQTT